MEKQDMKSTNLMSLNPIRQDEQTGCGIASVANTLGLSYQEVKVQANQLGIFADDTKLFSNTGYVRTLLAQYKIKTHTKELPFTSWEALPDLALLAIKYYEEAGKGFWHWVVFKRLNGQDYVLDSSQSLTSHLRQDFENMQPKWFIPMSPEPQTP